MQSLYSTALGFFQLNQSLLLRLGALYTLYLLYETQPQAAKKYKIKVSVGAQRLAWCRLLTERSDLA